MCLRVILTFPSSNITSLICCKLLQQSHPSKHCPGLQYTWRMGKHSPEDQEPYQIRLPVSPSVDEPADPVYPERLAVGVKCDPGAL
jgi:hypothetical protein